MASGVGKQCRKWNQPPPFITNTRAVTSTARQGHADDGGDAGPDRGGRGAGTLEWGLDDGELPRR